MMTPKKLNNKSADGRQLNLEALYTIAPSCFTEVQDPKTGETKSVVNFDILRTLLGGDAVEIDREMYQFTWPGKQEARLEAATETSETLRPVPQDSLDWNNTENIYIEGDNLRVLKLLQKSYLGKVKMIYIDPPYNTGKDFIYHDDFSRSATEENLAAGNIDEEGNRFRVNPNTNGRFHSDWCSMMYSRLLVAHSLLSEDGVIFISIDDNEMHNLRKICDEVFGESNFINCFMWLHGKGKKDTWSRTLQQYVLAYAKGKLNLPTWRDKVFTEYEFQNPDNDPKGVWFSGSISFNEERSNPQHPNYYTIESPSKIVWTRQWQVSFEEMQTLIQEGDIFFGYPPNYDAVPRLKIRPQEIDVIPQNIFGDCGTSKSAENEVNNLLSGKMFDYPKPTLLIKKIINFSSSSDSLILDFFSGSATTAHAVMQLNAEDGGKRKYICVQLEEETPEKSDARKAGYNSIPEIAKERIRRAGKKILEENPEVADTLDTGFRVFKLDSSNYEEVSKTPNEYDQAQLNLFLDNIKTDRNDLDLLFGSMLSWGVPLSLSQPLQKQVVDGCTIYNVTDGELVACFAEEVSEAVVRAMATMQPERVLFRDSCFAEDKMKINLFELFKQALDWDDKEALDNIRVI